MSLRYGDDLGRSRLVFSSDYNSHTDRSTFYFLETILKPPKTKSRQGKLSPKGPPLSVFTFLRKPTKPDVPIRSVIFGDADGDITNHIVMARTKTEEKHLADGPKSPKKKNLVRYPLYYVEKNYNKKSSEEKFQNKIQTAVSGTENTIKKDTGKIINRKIISGPLFQTERKYRIEPALNTTGEINPKNRHCLRGLDEKYGRWDEILRDILNGKLKIVQNKKRAESNTDDDDDDEDDEEMPEETGTPIVYDTSEKDGRYVPIRKNPEEDALQLHTDSKITGEKLKTQIGRTNRESKKPNRHGSIPVYWKFLGMKYKCLTYTIYITGTVWN